MKVIKKNDEKVYLVEKGFAKEKLNAIILETKMNDSAYGRLISVINELNKCTKTRVVAHDFFAMKNGVDFFYKVKEIGGNFVATIFASATIENESEGLFDWMVRLLEEMDMEDVVAYKCYKTDILPDKVRDAAEQLVEENRQTLVSVAGHYGFIFKPEDCPSIDVDLSMWGYVFAPSYAFIGMGWNKAFPVTATTLATTIQIIPEHMQRGMMAHHKNAITPAI